MAGELIYQEKKRKGDDGYKVISIRIDNSDLKKVDDIAELTGKSRNAIVIDFIEYGLEHSKIIKKEDTKS